MTRRFHETETTDVVARVLSDPAVATAVAEKRVGVVDREVEWRSLRGLSSSIRV
jgi:hypothetical protein